MATQVTYDACTAAYVNLVSYNKYASRTADTSEFNEVKEMMGQYINDGEWPAPKAKHGLALLVCHYYALDDTQDPDEGSQGSDLVRGPIVQEVAGDMSVTYDRYSQATAATITKDQDLWLLQTQYGKEFLGLRRTFKCGPHVT